jgi:hypothetical protein
MGLFETGLARTGTALLMGTAALVASTFQDGAARVEPRSVLLGAAPMVLTGRDCGGLGDDAFRVLPWPRVGLCVEPKAKGVLNTSMDFNSVLHINGAIKYAVCASRTTKRT